MNALNSGYTSHDHFKIPMFLSFLIQILLYIYIWFLFNCCMCLEQILHYAEWIT